MGDLERHTDSGLHSPDRQHIDTILPRGGITV